MQPVERQASDEDTDPDRGSIARASRPRSVTGWTKRRTCPTAGVAVTNPAMAAIAA